MSDVMIEARELTKEYSGAAKPVVAVHKVSFEVRRGEVLGFLGPNGAGKTTTMKILTCFIAPTSGTAKVNGADVWEDSIAVRESIGYLPESTPLYTEMLVVEYLDWVGQMRGLERDARRKRLKKVVEQTGLGDMIGREIGQLSKGYRQRVGLAQALLHEPKILILDEPMSGLDPNQAVEIRDLIKDIGKERTVILSTHNLAEVQVACNRVLIISRGKIVADDTPEGLRDRAGKRRFVAGVQASTNGKAREAFGKIKGVDKVRELSKAGDEVRYELVPVKDEDLRAEIFKAAVDAGFVLIELSATGENLENVFRELTTGPADAEPLDRKAAKKAITKAMAEPKVEAEAEEEDDDEDEDESAEAAADAGEGDEDEEAAAGGESSDDNKKEPA
jgi:ABC-2 type transport system ATP-binding protein